MLDFLKNLFALQYQSDIEAFIESKNPKSPADVEHWIQVYMYGQVDNK